ncbi:MAG TPA: VWA domain-containing protein [Thermoanaerobaculia bacterium]|nr:VWA domain-containing protein [Thermoanaerobaculia bacterium]
MRHRISLLLSLALLLPLASLRAQGGQTDDPSLWPEPERAFFQDGPGLLLTQDQRTTLRSDSPETRARWIQDFLAKDPIPTTPANELREAIDRRRRLANDEYLSTQDVRWQLLFLDGKPWDRTQIDCGTAFKPIEIWNYRRGNGPDGKPLEDHLVVFAQVPGEPYRLWLPVDSKHSLYTPEMEYWLQQWEELHSQIGAQRFDLQVCKQAKLIDDATGIPGLTGAFARRKKDVHPHDYSSYLEPPKELADWARAAAAGEAPAAVTELKVASAEMHFPERDGQRILTRLLVKLPPDAGVKPTADKTPADKLTVEGVVEEAGKPFDAFRMRFQQPVPAAGEPMVLAIDRGLRARTSFVIRLKIKDDTGGAVAYVTRGFRVPLDPVPEPEIAALPTKAGELVPLKTASGADRLLLLPPTDDVLIGLWRADAIVTGKRIEKVAFLVDGKMQLTTTRAPFTAEVRLAHFPSEQTVRAEGYDADGKLVAADEVIVNQPKGAFNVRVVSPAKGTRVQGTETTAKAEVVVPDGRRIKAMEFRVNDQLVASLTKPPWQIDKLAVPAGDLVYLTVVAVLDDDSKSEALRYLRAPQYVSEVDVDLVELYAAVTDHSGNLVNDLKQEDFEVYESGKKQELVKFDRVQNLPLTVCMLIDTSGSMESSLATSEKAAVGFLDTVMKPGDKAFAVSFSGTPELEIAPTDDIGAVKAAITGLQAVGETALHDALVHSLYYFRGVKGQRALVLLSDGDDNASYITFKDAMEYASRSGVAVYAIGLNLTFLDTSIKSKLGQLANSSGGQAFFTNNAKDLPGIYKQIESELRSRYLLAYNSSEAGSEATFRPVEIKVKKSGLKARSARGYYP